MFTLGRLIWLCIIYVGCWRDCSSHWIYVHLILPWMYTYIFSFTHAHRLYNRLTVSCLIYRRPRRKLWLRAWLTGVQWVIIEGLMDQTLWLEAALVLLLTWSHLGVWEHPAGHRCSASTCGIRICPTPESESEAEMRASLKRDKYVCAAWGSCRVSVQVQGELHLSRCSEHTRTSCCADVIKGRFHINSKNSFSANQVMLICSAPENDRTGK